jgi:hypothetical protein
VQLIDVLPVVGSRDPGGAGLAETSSQLLRNLNIQSRLQDPAGRIHHTYLIPAERTFNGDI